MFFKCKSCNKEVDTSKTSLSDVLLKAHMCFNCDFFLNARMVDRVIIAGRMYFIGKESQKYDKGSGGKKFRIKKYDKLLIIETTNLNYNGIIPEHLRDRLPDTAIFL